MDYNQTVNLPKTEFPMRASLPQREPDMVDAWQKEDLYTKIIENNKGKPSYVLHDGPPYANGDIHLGHALNKILKDFIVRYKNMSGYCATYIPGWDTHGLPIERQAIKKIGLSEASSPEKFRQVCKEFAEKYVENQKSQFLRLGSIGDYDHPYLTLHPEFEAKQIEIFGDMAQKGYIYKGLKPVYWCPNDRTALAEAEIEYMDDSCESIFVKFKVKDDLGKLIPVSGSLDNLYFVIWTTTTWTLPANVAICLGPDFEYTIVKTDKEQYVMASALVDAVMQSAGIENYTTEGSFTGAELEYIVTEHPFIDRESIVIVGDHVTLESGTGCVHTAPGHGVDDYNVCRNYKDIPIVVPVDARGVLTAEAGRFEGLTYEKANGAILDHLKEIDALLASQTIQHSYPHCWRCKSPVIFRATEQCFCSVEKFKEQAVDCIKGVKWLPSWGEERIINMVRDRADWCISRQRIWGVPIPLFYCEKCGEQHIDEDTIRRVADIFRKEGSVAWVKYSAKELLPEGYTCKKCGHSEFTKETDIMDVWFDSGSSYAAVIGQRGFELPADLYLEGNDQYRGWFQSSLLTSVATTGKAPYKTVITHGMVVDGEGKKMSKSLGNGVDPMDACKQYGADILRIWVASSDYQQDVRLSKEILKQISESYRKIRNTARYILGNIADFDPQKDMVSFADMMELDRYMLMRLDELVDTAIKGYEKFEFHTVFHALHNFCVVDMSNFYLDVIKDRLYIEATNGAQRRSAQSAIYLILHAITRLLAPVLAFTSEEIWGYLPHLCDDKEHVSMMDMPSAGVYAKDEAVYKKWQEIVSVSEDVKKALEIARTAKVIGSSLEAAVYVYTDVDISAYAQDLKTACIVSDAKIFAMQEASGDLFEGTVAKVRVEPAKGQKCQRCWGYSTSVGGNAKHPELCARCAEIVGDSLENS